ncbi:family 43 glycosylhydrolase [Microbacterium timonense]
MLRFTATDAAGPWSDGALILKQDGSGSLDGIDPDIAWGEDGKVYITFSGLVLEGEDAGRHLGIQQVRVDLENHIALEEPRSLWSGTGGQFPEAPHLYRVGGRWYLMIAEGGTERGHGVSIARGESPEGPFETAPQNPLVFARSTICPVQNTGHGDLVSGPAGEWLVRASRSAPPEHDPCVLGAGPRDLRHRRAVGGRWLARHRPGPTHVGVQRVDVYRTAENTDEWRDRWGKPVVLDEVLWWSKGGVLHGTSPDRIRFLEQLIAEAPDGVWVDDRRHRHLEHDDRAPSGHPRRGLRARRIARPAVHGGEGRTRPVVTGGAPDSPDR